MPERTSPTLADPESTGVPCRAMRRSSREKATTLPATPASSWRTSASRPTNSRPAGFTVQPSPAWMGEIVSEISWP